MVCCCDDSFSVFWAGCRWFMLRGDHRAECTFIFFAFFPCLSPVLLRPMLPVLAGGQVDVVRGMPSVPAAVLRRTVGNVVDERADCSCSSVVVSFISAVGCLVLPSARAPFTRETHRRRRVSRRPWVFG